MDEVRTHGEYLEDPVSEGTRRTLAANGAGPRFAVT